MPLADLEKLDYAGDLREKRQNIIRKVDRFKANFRSVHAQYLIMKKFIEDNQATHDAVMGEDVGADVHIDSFLSNTSGILNDLYAVGVFGQTREEAEAELEVAMGGFGPPI